MLLPAEIAAIMSEPAVSPQMIRLLASVAQIEAFGSSGIEPHQAGQHRLIYHPPTDTTMTTTTTTVATAAEELIN